MTRRKALRGLDKLSKKQMTKIQKEIEQDLSQKIAKLLVGFEPLRHELEKLVVGRVIEDKAAVNRKHSEAIKAGQARARARGLKLGGARNVPRFDHQRILRFAREGFTQNDIAVKLGCSQSLVSRVLRTYATVKERKR